MRAMGRGHGYEHESECKSEKKMAGVEDDKKMDASSNVQFCPHSGTESKSECPHIEYG